MIRIATFDIGKKNFAFVVQEFENITNLPKDDLDELFKLGKIVLF